MEHDTGHPRIETHSMLRKTGLAFLLLILFYSLFDLFGPFEEDLRHFDPEAMGRLETAMWRSYYDRRPMKLFMELAEVLRTQYHFPMLRSFAGAFSAARAAFIFKDGKQRRDYERALPSLESYFSAIRKTGNIPFDLNRTTRLELEWWIVHRNREQYPPDALGYACAQAASALYMVPVDLTLEHGRLRAEAMVIRDTKAKEGGVREEDWTHIDSLLTACYTSLSKVIVHNTSVAQ